MECYHCYCSVNDELFSILILIYCEFLWFLIIALYSIKLLLKQTKNYFYYLNSLLFCILWVELPCLVNIYAVNPMYRN